MATPTHRTHLIRLAVLLVAGVTGFVVVRSAMVPKTWNHKKSYREAALADIAKLPSIHGGNESCLNCHEDEEETHQTAMEDLLDGAHKNLSCESCHGPVAHHVADNKKIADAIVNYTRLACLNCHGNLVSLPADFPKFILSDEELPPNREAELLEAAIAAGDKKIYRHKKSVHDGMNCTECHISFHDPEP